MVSAPSWGRVWICASRDVSEARSGGDAGGPLVLPAGRMSFSLLPDCLCSRLRGSLDEAERVV